MLENNEESNSAEESKPRTINLYKVGDLVNFRLTKQSIDLIGILNQKKVSGVNISEYLATLIRVAEGLPVPASGEGLIPSLPEVKNQIKQAREEQFNVLVEKVLEKVMSSGMLANVSDNQQPVANHVKEVSNESNEDEVTQAKREEVKKAALSMLDWDDD